MSNEKNALMKANVKKLLELQDNQYCADCLAQTPDWASVNLGLFICIRCSGLHRMIGVHITQVRSVALDEWSEAQYQTMQKIGNVRGNEEWESQMPEYFLRPSPTSDQKLVREYFIREKYEKASFKLGAAPITFITEGLLWKETPHQKGKFQQRYFVLSDNLLSYFKKKGDSYPLNVIKADKAIATFDENVKNNQGMCIKVPGREYFLYHEDGKVLIAWINSIRQAQWECQHGKRPIRGQMSDEELIKLFSPNNVEVIKEGWQSKQGGHIKTWQKRWFALYPNFLVYFKLETDRTNGIAPKGIIPLQDGRISICSSKENSNMKGTGFCIATADRQYYIQSTSESEAQEWVDAMKDMLSRSNSDVD